MSAVRISEDFTFERPPEAPIFEPTVEEFRDPCAYLAKIRPLAEGYGICKIRPPPTWQPPFAVDIDNFRFTPRVQRINELEAKTRVKLQFLDRLAKFWELQGMQLKIPTVDNRFLDLHTLQKAVHEEGGFEMMAKDGKWSKVAVRLGYLKGNYVASSLRQHYERILYPYDVFLTHASTEAEDQKDVVVKVELGTPSKEEPNRSEHSGDAADSKSAAAQVIGSLGQPSGISTKTEDKVLPDVDPAASQTLISTSAETNTDHKECKKTTFKSELKKLQFLGAGPKMALPDIDQFIDNGFQDTTDGKYPKRRKREKPQTSFSGGLQCRSCEANGEYTDFLVCDECADAYHNFCLNPPLLEIPRGVWRCHKCIARVCSKQVKTVYGFEEGSREYTLQTFGEMADKFKQDYFGVPVHAVSCTATEKEFWRLVNSFDEEVVVEYGADNPAGEVGSGFPTESTGSLFPEDEDYINSPWNLNNIAGIQDSLLHFINADISGMKVPWCYVGMCFSCFAWHTEDHWTSSINYLHWGEPKTWYGVPSSKAELLEAVMKQNAPELFEQTPDLLHQLTTIMNPNTLMSAGVPVFRSDQHAGEIMVTFPRGYHAGFNQGYNFAEAVNFCFSDWLPMGRKCIEHYRVLKRQCVFSHDELVCKMASLSNGGLSLSQAMMAHRDMLSMVNEEKTLRKLLLSKGTVNAEREAFELLPDDERQCEVCKTTCFLSAVTCDCNDGKLVCLKHADELCNCPASQHCLRYRYTLNELLGLLTRLKGSIDVYEKWSNRAKAVCDAGEGKKHSLSVIRELISEAHENRCTESALFRTLESAVALSVTCSEIAKRFPMKTVDESRLQSVNSKNVLKLPKLGDLSEDLDNACVEIEEENIVRQFLSEVDLFNVQVRKAVCAKQLDVVRLKELLSADLLCNFDLPIAADLNLAIKQAQWLEDVHVCTSHSTDQKTSSNSGLAALKRLAAEGTKLVSHPSCKRTLADLQKLLTSCETMERKLSVSLESRPPETLETLEALIEESKAFPFTFPSISKLQLAIEEATKWNSETDVLLNNDKLPWIETLENQVSRGKIIPVKLGALSVLEAKLSAAQTWLDNTRKAFIFKKSSSTLLEVLSPKTDTHSSAVESAENATSANRNQEMMVQLRLERAHELKTMLGLRQKKTKLETVDQLNSSKCFCQQPSLGSMVQCLLCRDVFHARCVSFPKSPRVPVAEKTILSKSLVVISYDMPFFCHRCCRSRRPVLNQVLSLLLALNDLGIMLPEGVALQSLTNRTIHWLERARPILQIREVVEFVNMRQPVDDESPPLQADLQAGSQAVSSSSTKDCIEGSSPLRLSDKLIAAMDALLVEGDLLEISLSEKESLRAVLRCCHPDIYRLFVFQIFNISCEEFTDDNKWEISKSSNQGDLVQSVQTSKSLSDSGIGENIISISDDEDKDELEICAAKKCLKPSGDGISMVQCVECERWFHEQCTGHDQRHADHYTCHDCTDRKPMIKGRLCQPSTPTMQLALKHAVVDDDDKKVALNRIESVRGDVIIID